MTPIDDVIAASSIGAGLRDIEKHGIDAHLTDLEEEMHSKKRRKGTSPTQRTLAELRKRGWTAQVVERPWNRHTKRTLDLFGVLDVVALIPPRDMAPPRGCTLSPVGAILGIQATTGAHHADRRTKILAEPRAADWVAAGGRLELWTWSQRAGQRQDGSKSARPKWALRVETYAEMLAASEAGR